ncbi:MAG TPA: glycosyltransferase, partial [Acidimicrobiales bacterium]
MRRLAVLSMHTSPLAQPGTGDGGGMNVYVRELSAGLARAGVACDVYTRAESAEAAAIVAVEPGLRVHHIPAGALGPVPKQSLPGLVDEFADGVLARMAAQRSWGEDPAELIHANYWLSGVAGHRMKHELGLPLVSTFHTLARVKAESSPEELSAHEPARRTAAEVAVIGCSDAILASCDVEALQIAELYHADPDRIELVPPGVDHAFFAPGNRAQARRALGLPAERRMLLFVGRIQPLKGLDVAIGALAALSDHLDAFLVVVGGPSGPQGEHEVARMHALARDRGVAGRVRFLPPQRHELLSTFYRAADVALVPSRSESFGLVALEASACGTPVVATAVGGLRTLVEDGATGFLVEDRDPFVFAKAVAAVLGDRDLA